LPDDALYALALYIYSLQPPSNPNPLDAKAEAQTHAIGGHEFGLHLEPAEREQLIAFLQTL